MGMARISDSGNARFYGLDHLRALAIILVMIFHYGMNIPVWLRPFSDIGWSGVDLFFVLSGYLIGDQLLRESQLTGSISLKRFYMKRSLRIIPAYLAVLILYYTIPAFREGSGLPPLWRFLTFTQNIGLDANNHKAFSHAWSLCVEEQFYILLPLIILVVLSLRLQKKTAYYAGGLIIAGFFFRLHSWDQYVQPLAGTVNRVKVFHSFLGNVYYPTYNRMDGLIVGVCIAAIVNFKPKIMNYIADKGNWVLFIGLVLLANAYALSYKFISFDTAVFGFPLISLAYGLMVMAALCPSCILYKFESRMTGTIAMLSYAMYLTHKQLFHLTRAGLNHLGFDTKSMWLFPVSFVVAGLGGLLLNVTVEKPFLSLRKHLLLRMG